MYTCLSVCTSVILVTLLCLMLTVIRSREDGSLVILTVGGKDM